MRRGIIFFILVGSFFYDLQPSENSRVVARYNSDIHFNDLKGVFKNCFAPLISDEGLSSIVKTIKKDTIVYTVNGKVVGFCEYKFESCDVAGIEFLGIHSDHRKKGYGSKLLCTTLLILHKQKIKTVELCVDSSDSQALRLYQTFGFNITSYDNRAITMSKSL